MGLEFNLLSEMAALQPIRTAVSASASRVTPKRPDHDGGKDTAADTNWVTTTSSDFMVPPPRQDGNIDTGYAKPTSYGANVSGRVTPTAIDSVSTAPRQDILDTCCITPTASEASARQDGGTECGTPTSASSEPRPATVCPPAPRKPRPTKRKRCDGSPQRFFFPVPDDLATVFVARAASLPLLLPAKKIRLHAVR